MEAAIYLRVSTVGQRDGASLSTQEADCRRYAEAKGMTVVEKYLDVQSGLKVDRVDYTRMLDDAGITKNGLPLKKDKRQPSKFQRIICWRMDRFGRSVVDAGLKMRDLQENGVLVESATEPNESRTLRTIIMAMAEDESTRISVRVTANRQTRSKDGKRTSRPPFGYKNIPHSETGTTMEPSEDGPIVTEAFRRYTTGRYTLIDLVKYIGEASASPHKLKTRQSVHGMLRNPVYLGQIQHGKWARDSAVSAVPALERKAAAFTCQGAHPPLVDRETFDRCQEIMASHKSRKHSAPHSPFLFVGLVMCQCGSRYTGHRNGGHSALPGYYCTARNGRGNNHCSSPGVAESKLRDAVIKPLEQWIAEWMLPQARMALMVRDAQAQQRQRNIESAGRDGLAEELARLEKRLAGYEDSLADGLMDRERFIARRDEVLPQIASLKEQLAAAPAKVVTLEPLCQALDMLCVKDGALCKGDAPLDNADWRYLLELTLEKIVIEDGRPKVEWREVLMME